MSLYFRRLHEAQDKGYAQLNPYTWIVPSNSTDEDASNRMHMVTWDATSKRLFCSCDGMRFRDECSGITDIRNMLSVAS